MIKPVSKQQIIKESKNSVSEPLLSDKDIEDAVDDEIRIREIRRKKMIRYRAKLHEKGRKEIRISLDPEYAEYYTKLEELTQLSKKEIFVTLLNFFIDNPDRLTEVLNSRLPRERKINKQIEF